jgi:hypothetical protein
VASPDVPQQCSQPLGQMGHHDMAHTAHLGSHNGRFNSPTTLTTVLGSKRAQQQRAAGPCVDTAAIGAGGVVCAGTTAASAADVGWVMPVLMHRLTWRTVVHCGVVVHGHSALGSLVCCHGSWLVPRLPAWPLLVNC